MTPRPSPQQSETIAELDLGKPALTVDCTPLSISFSRRRKRFREFIASCQDVCLNGRDEAQSFQSDDVAKYRDRSTGTQERCEAQDRIADA
jgi:hypothetical protein